MKLSDSKIIGEQVKVLTTDVFKEQIGTVIAECRKSFTVSFDGKIGIYNFDTNNYEIISH